MTTTGREGQAPPLRHAGAGRARTWAVVTGLVLLVAAVYGQTGRFDSLDFDDGEYVFANPNVLAGLTWRGVGWALTAFHSANWHPLTWLSHMLDVELFGSWPGPHHLVNAGFHAANAVLLFLVLRAATAAFWPSAVVTALFAVHPLNVETVAWIFQRKSVVSTLFLLLALGAWISWTRKGGIGRYLAAAALLALGLLAKPMLVSAPLLFLALDFWPLSRGRRRIVEKLPLFAIAGAAGVATLFAQSKWNAIAPAAEYPLPERLANALVSTAAYLRDAVWPAGLACFYPHPASLGEKVGVLPTVGAAALLTLITTFTIAARKTRPWLLFGWAWYLVALAPVSGIVQAGSQARADRYAYVPLIGIFVAVVWEVSSRLKVHATAPALGVGIASAAVAVFALLASRQTATWRNGETLYTHALAVTRRNWLASNNLGNFRLSHDEPKRALAAFEEAARMKPDYEQAWYNQGVALMALSRPAEAVSAYRESLCLDASNTDGWVNLGLALLSVRRVPEGLQAYETALSQRPEDSIALHGAAVARSTLGDSRGALEYLGRLERLDPARATELRRDLGIAR